VLAAAAAADVELRFGLLELIVVIDDAEISLYINGTTARMP
jgi:hypothetical protein